VNIWREVEADGAGVIVNDDLDGVADGLERMLTMSDTARAAMGAAARRAFETRFDLERNALQLLDVIAGASSSSPSPATASRSAAR
jgi:glycosyltransferase involved in cell wall biosynthesis